MQPTTEKNRSLPDAEPVAAETQPLRPTPDERRPFPTAGDLLAMLGIVLGMQVVASLTVTFVMAVLGLEPGADDPLQQGRCMAAVYLLAMVPAYFMVLGYRHARGGTGPIGCFSTRGLNPVLLLWAFVFMLAVSVVCEPLLALLPAPKPYAFGRGGWALAVLVAAAPVLEELLCRGVVLGALRARYGAVAAWLVSALFFGVLHLQPVLVVNAFVIGLILGYVYMVTDSLWATMILHALNNAVAYLLLLTGHGDTMLSELVDGTVYWVVYGTAAVVTVLSAWMSARTLRRMKEARKKEEAA